jgi:hypothetical protein
MTYTAVRQFPTEFYSIVATDQAGNRALVKDGIKSLEKARKIIERLK